MSKNTIIELSNELEYLYTFNSSTKGRYSFVYERIKEKIKENTNEIYQYKGDLKDADYGMFMSTMIAISSMCITCLGIFFTIEQVILKQNAILLGVYAFIILTGITIIIVAMVHKINKYKNVFKWTGHIEIALDNLLEDIHSIELKCENEKDNCETTNLAPALTIHMQNMNIDIYNSASIDLIHSILNSLKEVSTE